LKRCYGCMHLKESSPHCEHCGFDERNENSSHQLPQGTIVGGQYVLGKVLGQGGFGITYIGWDRITEQTVAVKEYFPSGFAGRDSNTKAVTSYDGQDENIFGSNKKRFLREAEALGRLWNIPQIVKVLRCFEENGTAYIAMEYVDGVDLRKYLKRRGCPMTMEETMDILGPIIEALSYVHQAELVHRDISPDNIMILPNGSAKLLDFGAARYVENADAEKERATSTQAILKHGFAPPEQYQSHGALGPWTDVYAICATMYYCLTGKVPPEAMSRMIERKPLHWDMISGLTVRQRNVLEKGMALNPKDRFASAQELWNKLGGTKKKETPKAAASTPKKEKPPGNEKQKKTPARTAPVIQEQLKREKKPKPNKEKPKKEKKSGAISTTDGILAAIAIVLAVLVGIGFFSPKKPASEKPSIQESVPAATMEAAEEATIPTQPPLEITPLLEFEDAQLGETAAVSVLSGHSAEALQWFSDDPAVASVSKNGTVTSVGYGMAVITAQYQGQTVSCTVYVDRTPNVVCSYTENETGLTITGYEGTLSSEVILPRKIDGKPVTMIGPDVFSQCVNVTSVSVPESITAIADSAFRSCSSLEEITIPGSVVSIGNSAFNGCTKLENVIIEDGVVTIGNGAFFDCYKLKNIRIPNTVTSIGVQAFWRCMELETITIPGSVESIGNSAFIHCNSLKNVTIEDGVTAIGGWAFFRCSQLETVAVPDSVVSIGERTFEECTKLSYINIPEGVTVIAYKTFWGCSQLESIVLPEGVTAIGNEAFYGCTNLESITIPESVASIGDQAFYSANRLENATISPNCTVGKEAFPGRCEVSYY